MGGKSKKNTTTSQSTSNIVNDGDYAGVSGGVTHDESDNSIEDSYNTETNIEQEYNYELDSSVNDSNNTDNSIEDSYNTETNIEQEFELSGANSGNSGTINVLDGGVIDSAFEFGGKALDANTNIAEKSIDSAKENLKESLNFGNKAIGAVEGIAETAIEEQSDLAKHVTKTVADNTKFALEKSAEQSENFADNLTSSTEVFADNLSRSSETFQESLTQLQNEASSNNVRTIEHIASSATEDKAIIAELARNAALEGQDIVAKTSADMVKYIAIGLGTVAIALLFKR